MDKNDKPNVVPLTEQAAAHRTRLIERAKQSNVTDLVVLKNSVSHIDRWLINFAYKHTDFDE